MCGNLLYFFKSDGLVAFFDIALYHNALYYVFEDYVAAAAVEYLAYYSGLLLELLA